MLFSIVVPVYNVAKYLDECMESIIGQVKITQNEYEVILVNDGSTDDSGKICDQYQKKHPDLIKVFHKPNQGLLMTRRFGYKQIKGEYIINCDSDDVLEMDALEKIKDVIESYNKPDVIIFNHNKYDGIRKEIAFENVLSSKTISQVARQEVLTQFMLGYSLSSVCVATCKRSCINIEADYTKYACISNGEDSMQKIEQFEKAETYVYLNQSLYNYRISSGMTRKFDPYYYKGFTTVFIKLQYFEKDIVNFDNLMTVKVLSTAGRAITQSRYGKRKTMKEHIKYLRSIREEYFFEKYITCISSAKIYLQKDHFILLLLLRYRFYKTIVLMLNFKNKIG